MLATYHTSNIETWDNVVKQRKEIEDLVRGLEYAVEDLEGAALRDEDEEGMRIDSREVEQELRTMV